MKLHYYPETDSLYIELAGGSGVETREIADGFNVDFDAEGGIVGLDIEGASKKLDLTTIETVALPIKATRAAQSRGAAHLSKSSGGRAVQFLPCSRFP
jgi:uncharacterized protein YuzE